MADTAARSAASPPPPAELLAAPGFLIRRLYQAYLASWVRTVDPKLTGPQFALLQAADACPGLDQRSLASVVSLDTSTMADVARRLEVRGLLERSTAESDARRKLLYVTDEGKEVLREVNSRARQLDERLLQPYTPRQREEILRDLTALADHWESLSEEG